MSATTIVRRPHIGQMRDRYRWTKHTRTAHSARGVYLLLRPRSLCAACVVSVRSFGSIDHINQEIIQWKFYSIARRTPLHIHISPNARLRCAQYEWATWAGRKNTYSILTIFFRFVLIAVSFRSSVLSGLVCSAQIFILHTHTHTVLVAA